VGDEGPVLGRPTLAATLASASKAMPRAANRAMARREAGLRMKKAPL
jgi:hypothetical protein